MVGPTRATSGARWHALDFLPPRVGDALDVGCNEGALLADLHARGVPRLHGIDINTRAVDMARQRLQGVGAEHATILHGSADHLPFSTQSMDAVFCLEVLEHVPAELREGVVAELRRVLRADGQLILSVPAAGIFAGLDPANARLRFPRLFDLASRAVGGAGREAGFVGQKHGIVWHHHFAWTELLSLLRPGFEVLEVRWRGTLVTPVCNWLQFPFYRRGAHESRLLRLLQKLERWDMSRPVPRSLAYNVILLARAAA